MVYGLSQFSIFVCLNTLNFSVVRQNFEKAMRSTLCLSKYEQWGHCNLEKHPFLLSLYAQVCSTCHRVTVPINTWVLVSPVSPVSLPQEKFHLFITLSILPLLHADSWTSILGGWSHTRVSVFPNCHPMENGESGKSMNFKKTASTQP